MRLGMLGSFLVHAAAVAAVWGLALTGAPIDRPNGTALVVTAELPPPAEQEPPPPTDPMPPPEPVEPPLPDEPEEPEPVELDELDEIPAPPLETACTPPLIRLRTPLPIRSLPQPRSAARRAWSDRISRP